MALLRIEKYIYIVSKNTFELILSSGETTMMYVSDSFEINISEEMFVLISVRANKKEVKETLLEHNFVSLIKDESLRKKLSFEFDIEFPKGDSNPQFKLWDLVLFVKENEYFLTKFYPPDIIPALGIIAFL